MKTTIFRNKTIAAFITLATATAALTSCVDDKGNYDYKTLPEVRVEGIPAVTEVLAYLDHIKITPTIYIDGKQLADGDPNYTVRYRFGHKGMGSMGYDEEAKKSIVWEEFVPTSGYNLDVPANFSTGAYILWMTVTHNATGAVASMQYDISVGSTTYEGWLVLCDEGSDNSVRLDMISKINSQRTESIHDICQGLPDLRNATCILAFPQEMSPGDQIHLLSREGSYNIDAETMECNPATDEFNANYFVFSPGETIIKEDLFSATSYTWLQKYKVCFGENGNAYVMVEGTYGAAYSTAINTLEEGTDIQFKVAPFVGFNWTRPWTADRAANMLFYDTTNRRFLIFFGDTDFVNNERMQLNIIADPTGDEPSLFSYTTGKDMLYMQSTRRSNGLVYAVLQDPATGARSIYGINMGGNTPVQELYDESVSAPDFNNATAFAFDNRFPLLFYAAGSKLYCYNLGTKLTTEIATGLADSEEITNLKFNLYRTPDYSTLADQSEEFMNLQYQLVVCSFDASVGDNGGKVTFFTVDGVNNTATKGLQYTGFAKIRDIIYRERCI